MAVLALQGDYDAHARALAEHDIDTYEARTAADLHGLDALVLPGGESSTMLKLMEGTELARCLQELARAGVPILATCAGVILLAREVRKPPQPSLGVLDVTVERNAYGRQVDSIVASLEVVDSEALGTDVLEGVFIRAPRVIEVGAAVRVLARRGDDPVLLRQGNLLAATFHPELSKGSPAVALFARMAGGQR